MLKNNSRLDKIKNILACPDCRGSLKFNDEAAVCEECNEKYPIRNEKIYFITTAAVSEDFTDKLKEKLKRLLGKYYYVIGVNVFAPTYPLNFIAQINKYVSPDTRIVVDVGSGNNRLDDNIICLDLFDYENVDIVCDVENIPFKESSVDAFVSRSMLEHVPDPSKVVDQFYRLTKNEGVGLHLIPFMYPFHASPYDFHRFTSKGAKVLFKQWSVLDQSNKTGPFTLLLTVSLEFFSIILSFGNKKIKAIVGLLLCLILFPIKYLDAPFVNRKSFLTMAPTILTIVKKC